jgi:hypothetical protein
MPGSTNWHRGDERGQQGGDTVVLDDDVDGRNNRRQRWRRKGSKRNTREERWEVGVAFFLDRKWELLVALVRWGTTLHNLNIPRASLRTL